MRTKARTARINACYTNTSGEITMGGNKGRAFTRARSTVLALVAGLAMAACQTASIGPELDAADASPPKRMVTQGVAHTIIAENLTKCAFTHPKMNVRVAAVGR